MHKNTRFPSPVFLKIWTGVIIKIKNFKKNFFFEKMENFDYWIKHPITFFVRDCPEFMGYRWGRVQEQGGLKVFFGHQMIHVSQIAKKKQQKTR